MDSLSVWDAYSGYRTLVSFFHCLSAVNNGILLDPKPILPTVLLYCLRSQYGSDLSTVSHHKMSCRAPRDHCLNTTSIFRHIIFFWYHSIRRSHSTIRRTCWDRLTSLPSHLRSPNYMMFQVRLAFDLLLYYYYTTTTTTWHIKCNQVRKTRIRVLRQSVLKRPKSKIVVVAPCIRHGICELCAGFVRTRTSKRHQAQCIRIGLFPIRGIQLYILNEWMDIAKAGYSSCDSDLRKPKQ